MVQEAWLTAARLVAERGIFPTSRVLPPEIRDSESAEATPIRVVDDPNAPSFRVVDYDKSHPFRQKEVLAEVHARLPGVNVNSFDLLAIRHTFNIDRKPEFSHQSKFGTRQYSAKFLEWLISEAQKDPEFFQNVRKKFGRGSRLPA